MVPKHTPYISNQKEVYVCIFQNLASFTHKHVTHLHHFLYLDNEFVTHLLSSSITFRHPRRRRFMHHRFGNNHLPLSLNAHVLMNLKLFDSIRVYARFHQFHNRSNWYKPRSYILRDLQRCRRNARTMTMLMLIGRSELAFALWKRRWNAAWRFCSFCFLFIMYKQISIVGV